MASSYLRIYECLHHLAAICLSTFFKRDKNLLTFLRKAIKHEELRECKLDLLRFMYQFIVVAGKCAVDYCVDIKDTCVCIFNSEKFTDVRCATFPIIKKVTAFSQASEYNNKASDSQINIHFVV